MPLHAPLPTTVPCLACSISKTMKRLVFFYIVCIATFCVDIDAAAPSPTTVPKAALFYPTGRDRPHNYKIFSDEVVYSGWRKVIRRSVSSPVHHHHSSTERTNDDSTEQRVIDFDVIDQAHHTGGAVIIFAWNTTSKTATIVREYMPGPHRVLSGLAAGIVEVGKHSSMEENNESASLCAARYELEEEWYVYVNWMQMYV